MSKSYTLWNRFGHSHCPGRLTATAPAIISCLLSPIMLSTASANKKSLCWHLPTSAVGPATGVSAYDLSGLGSPGYNARQSRQGNEAQWYERIARRMVSCTFCGSLVWVSVSGHSGADRGMSCDAIAALSAAALARFPRDEHSERVAR